MTLVLVTVAVLCMQYAACVALYHSNERRSMVELVAVSRVARTLLKIVGFCLLIISIVCCASLQGWERGIPVWLCLIGVTGFASLYVSAYKAAYHVKSGIASLVFTVILVSGSLLIDKPIDNSQKVTQHAAEN